MSDVKPTARGSRASFVWRASLLALLAAAVGYVIWSLEESRPTAPALENVSPPENSYAGDEACFDCHQQITSTYHETAHYFTSRPPTRDSIKGNFDEGSNVLTTVNTNLYFKMETTERGFFQTGALQTPAYGLIHRTERIGVVIGSGRKGQSYLFWEGDELFQLPVSYWTELDTWVNSPGFEDGTANFERPITPRCLECHASSFRSLAPPVYRYEESSLMLGIVCEKCHGSGRDHIARYRSQTPPESPADGAIINPARLSRERQMDLCALCHASGRSRENVAALSFTPGDVLDEFVEIPQPSVEDRVDVHGGHVQLLQRSRCYQSSSTLNCITCHDVHTTQRDATTYAAKCLSCHQIESCGQFATLGHAIDRQCVECHMPLQPTELIVCSANGRNVQPKMRNHKIAIYRDAQLLGAQ